MKVLLFVLPLLASAQSLTVNVSPAVVAPGGSATATVTFADCATAGCVAGLQFTLPTGITAGAPALGTASNSAQKVLSCTPTLCMIAGSDGTSTPTLPLNVNAFPAGSVLTIPLTAPSTGGVTVAVNLTSPIAVDPTGKELPITVTAGSFKVLSKYDLDGSGVVDGSDVQIALRQATGQATCTNGDVNGDGKCTVTDVVLVILAAMGRITG